MQQAPSLLVDTAQAMRGKRLTQIATMVLVGLGIALLAYTLDQKWSTVIPLTAAMFMMVVCLYLGRLGLVDLANVILLSSITAMASALMWLSQGLRDATLLTYPVILIMAGMLVSVRVYLWLQGAMLLFTLFLTYATATAGWRVEGEPGNPWDLMRDVMLILVISGFSVWLIMHDLQNALAKLKAEIARFHASQKQLTYLSQHDSLTGLPNRTLGRERISQAITLAERQKTRVALLFVDLDHFKAINDSLGHAAGDEFLKQVALRLQQSVRKSDIVARQGGDEFVIGLTDVANDQDVVAAAATVLERLAGAFVAKDTEISASCSIGIAMYPQDGVDFESLLRQADMAMYQAKEAGRNTFRFFDEAMNADMQQSLLLISNLRAALVRKEFVLYYQPVMDLASGQLVGVEALVRWMHPDKGLISPLEFIPAAEKSGLIVELGEWVLGEACRQLMAWRAAGCKECVMAVNLSPVQFRRGNVEVLVENALRHSGLPPHCLELEITESTLIQDTEKFLSTLQKLKALGVRLSIDDFGTGYSNLSYLQRFKVDKLKIDQSFVHRLMDGSQEKAIVSAIIQMAKSLHLGTTAEGIEDEAVRQALLDLGCTLGQGYYFSRPKPAAEMEALLLQQ